MGIALSAALDGRRAIAIPGAFVNRVAAGPSAGLTEKGDRVFELPIPVTRSRRTLEVSTMTREGDREVVRKLPFALVNMDLAARHPGTPDYPPFDALDVFSDGPEPAPADDSDTGQIYGASVESEISLKVVPFSFDKSVFAMADNVGTADAEALVRSMESRISDEPVQVASLSQVDPIRFDLTNTAADYEPGSAFRVVEENVSIATPDPSPDKASRFLEEIIPFRESMPIVKALADDGFDDDNAAIAAERLSDLLSSQTLDSGNVLRIGIENRDGKPEIVRLSVYRGDEHILTIAKREDGRFEPAAAPPMSQSVADAFDENATEAPLRSDMPTVYDGIYQAALAHGLDERLCQQLIRMLAADVDFQSTLSPQDRLTVLYSLEPGKETATDASEILYVEAKFGDTVKRYYRFRTKDDDHTGYYDEEGRSSKPFLIRNPVPNARVSSPFGARTHPVLGYKRMHWGVDWAAPKGSPILATGDGVIERAGWTSGYGRQTVIQHANGYESSYAHQSAFAKGIVAGARVHQGQIIGYIGTSGLSTGYHTHYELSVNGKRVDPMRIKLPARRVLQGPELDAFKRERDRIDHLLDYNDQGTPVASR